VIGGSVPGRRHGEEMTAFARRRWGRPTAPSEPAAAVRFRSAGVPVSGLPDELVVTHADDVVLEVEVVHPGGPHGGGWWFLMVRD
jgi:hypothetical protein